MGERREPGFHKDVVEARNPVGAQEEHRRNVKGTREGLVCRHGAVKLPVKVLRSKTVKVHRNIRKKSAGKNGPVLQRRLIQKRLKYTARRPRRARYVNLGTRPLALRGRIPHVGHNLPRRIVNYHGGHVCHALCRKGIRAQTHRLLHRPLQRQPYGRARLDAFRASLHIVRRIRRQRYRPVRKRLQHGLIVGIIIYIPMLQQPQKQPVALFKQLLPSLPGMQRRRRIRQHRQKGRFPPAQIPRRNAEITPRSSLQTNHVPSERSMCRILSQYVFLGMPALQPHCLNGLNDLLPQRPLLPPGNTYHLHGDGTSPAHHMPAARILLKRPADCQHIHTRMPPETPVLELDERRGEPFRHRLLRRETPLPVGSNPGPQKLPLCRFHHRGIHRIPEQPLRQYEKPQECKDATCGTHCGFSSEFHRVTTAVPAAVDAATEGSYMAPATTEGST